MGKHTHSLNFWTLDQFNSALSCTKTENGRISLLLLFYSGMRIGELLGLTLGDFDFQANTININKSLQHFSANNIVVTPPKTENSIRKIYMPAAVMQEVQDYSKRIYGITPTDRLFTFTKSLVGGTIKRAAEEADIPNIRIHDIRHSHVSLLIDMGFGPHLIAERIGDTVQMVNNTYGHLYPAKHYEVAERLNEMIVPK